MYLVSKYVIVNKLNDDGLSARSPDPRSESSDSRKRFSQLCSQQKHSAGPPAGLFMRPHTYASKTKNVNCLFWLKLLFVQD